ncbi:MAG: LamG domain-containing protein, partial [Mucilaginibacter sp.]
MKKLFNKNTIVVILAVCGLSSCYKKFDPSSYAPPLNVNGFTSADQIESSALVAHWGFNGDVTDSVSKTAGVATGTSFTAGLKNHGQALQGANNAYVVSAVPAAIQSLHSFTLSLWVNKPQNTTGAV